MRNRSTPPAERVALVTGGARGIGAAISRRLANDGHAVIINYATSGAAADELVDEITAAGGRACAVGADVSVPAEVDRLFTDVTARFGPPGIVVNNAGISFPASAVRLDVETWDRLIAVNLSAAFYCTHAALPAMYERGWGRVIFLGSAGGGRAITIGMSAYAAAKAGLVAMAKSIAQETSRRGITVNTVVPGFVETDMTRSSGPGVVETLRETWPEIPAEAVAGVVSFLASVEAEHVSGEDIAVWRGGPSPVARPR